MASFEPDLLILLIGLAAIVLTFAIIAAVLYLYVRIYAHVSELFVMKNLVTILIREIHTLHSAID